MISVLYSCLVLALLSSPIPPLVGGSSSSVCPLPFCHNNTGNDGVVLFNYSGIPSSNECCDRCTNLSGCTTFVYHQQGHHDAGNCKLMKSLGQAHFSEGAVLCTTVKPAPPVPPPPPVTPPPLGPVNPPLGYQPNIVLIMTDDQDVELGGLEPMPKLKKLVGDVGVTMQHWYVNTPVCCPSRTESLSGRYHHNIRDRNGPEWNRYDCGDEAVGKPHLCGCMRVNASADFEAHTYATYLQAAGYYTGYFGKYLNPPAMDPYCHNAGVRVPGWDEFLGMCVTAYYNIPWVTSQGLLNHTGSAPNEYSTAIVGNATVAFIRKAAAAYHATHTPFFDQQYADRWRTLLSVDDLVEAVVDELTAADVLDNTFVLYTSDHGYHLGHLRLSPGKQHFYEFDARVPMLLRGPGLHAGATPPLVAGNVDLAPTFLWLAGVGVPSRMDGRPVIAQLLEHTLPRPHEETGTRAQTPTSALWRTSYLVEHSGLHGWAKNTRINDCPNNTYRSLRIVNATAHTNIVFAELTSTEDYEFASPYGHELYDLDVDPYQLTNLWENTSAVVRSQLLDRLQREWQCEGKECP